MRIQSKQASLHISPTLLGFGIIVAVFFSFLLFWPSARALLTGKTSSISLSQNFYTEPVQVALEPLVPGEIFYTLDGSAPSAQSHPYTTPFTVSETTLVRWAIFRSGVQYGDIQEHDIFMNAKHSIPVISVATDPKNLWSPETGIAVEGEHNNRMQNGKEWERPATVRAFSPNGQLLFSHQIGLRLHGRAQREMPQQSFRLLFKDEDGRDTSLSYPVFGEAGNSQYESLVLRNGGGDAPYAMLREQLASEIVRRSESSVATTLGKPVVLYLNGKYWGLYYLRERFDESYFNERYRVRDEALALVEVPLDSSEQRGTVLPDNKQSETSAKDYNDLLANARRCPECLLVESVTNDIALGNFIDYMIFELFFANFDWPYNNVKAWRYQADTTTMPEADVIPELDGRFRWLLFDVDVGFGASIATPSAMINAAQGNPYTQLVDDAFPFRNFFYQQPFQNLYEQRVENLSEETLSAENLRALVDELANDIRPEMPAHIARWSAEPYEHGSPVPPTLEDWENRVELLKIFVEERAQYFPEVSKDWIRAHPEN